MSRGFRTINAGEGRGKIIVDVSFAPVEVDADARDNGSRSHRSYQGQRCPNCGILVASGRSYQEHLHSCDPDNAGVHS